MLGISRLIFGDSNTMNSFLDALLAALAIAYYTYRLNTAKMVAAGRPMASAILIVSCPPSLLAQSMRASSDERRANLGLSLPGRLLFCLPRCRRPCRRQLSHRDIRACQLV